MQRLEDAELSRSPCDVLEIISKLGKGSYGSVFKARYKTTGGIVAVKKVPVDSDLTDIVKEISIMQQCDSPFIVKCYGSLFDSQDLWICMEYCGAGSIADIMRLRGKTLNEDEIATVLHYSLRGLDYLHQMRKIHRDIKAGNILLLESGAAKLADFGVAGQLSDTLAKRNTVIGTPYWMAPEVIQEIGYNYSADIWSLGITAIEMADGKPPLADIHPMRALFMIPSQPPPTFRNPTAWSDAFRDFVTACLSKTPEVRPTAAALLQTEFIRNSKSCSVLLPLIDEANTAREKRLNESKAVILTTTASSDAPATDHYSGHLTPHPKVLNEAVEESHRTLVQPKHHITDEAPAGTLVSLRSDTKQDSVDSLTLEEDFGTMVINPSDDEAEEDTGSVVVHGSEASMDGEEREALELLDAAVPGNEGTLTRKVIQANRNVANQPRPAEDKAAEPAVNANGPQRPFAPFSRALQQSGLFPGATNYDPGALNRLSYVELQQLLTTLTTDLETELRNLAVRYRHKRQPLLDAIAEKTSQATEAKIREADRAGLATRQTNSEAAS